MLALHQNPHDTSPFQYSTFSSPPHFSPFSPSMSSPVQPPTDQREEQTPPAHEQNFHRRSLLLSSPCGIRQSLSPNSISASRRSTYLTCSRRLRDEKTFSARAKTLEKGDYRSAIEDSKQWIQDRERDEEGNLNGLLEREAEEKYREDGYAKGEEKDRDGQEVEWMAEIEEGTVNGLVDLYYESRMPEKEKDEFDVSDGEFGREEDLMGGEIHSGHVVQNEKVDDDNHGHEDRMDIED